MTEDMLEAWIANVDAQRSEGVLEDASSEAHAATLLSDMQAFKVGSYLRVGLEELLLF